VGGESFGVCEADGGGDVERVDVGEQSGHGSVGGERGASGRARGRGELVLEQVVLRAQSVLLRRWVRRAQAVHRTEPPILVRCALRCAFAILRRRGVRRACLRSGARSRRRLLPARCGVHHLTSLLWVSVGAVGAARILVAVWIAARQRVAAAGVYATLPFLPPLGLGFKDFFCWV
jgi:hypothetical protein